MDFKFNGIVRCVERNKVHVSVVNQHKNEVDLCFPRKMFASWDSVNDGDFFAYRIWNENKRMRHEVVRVDRPRLSQDVIDEIDMRISKLHLD